MKGDVKQISLLSLNVRGIRNNQKRKLLFQFLVKQGTDIIFLQETFLTKDLEKSVQKDWNGTLFHSFGSSHSRGVLILLKESTHVPASLIHTSDDGRILIISTEIDSRRVILMNVYAPTEKKTKELFFKKMDRVLNDYGCNGSQVLIAGGDFNCINNPRIDTIGNKTVYKQSPTYMQFIKKFKMIDIWRKLNVNKKQYTYRSKHLKMASRLDFWLVHAEYVEYIKNASIKPVSMCPDHCAVTISISLTNNLRGPSYWKMNNALLKNYFYKKGVRDIIQHTNKEFNSKVNQQYAWDLCKLRIKNYTTKFAKKLRQSEKKELIALEQKLEELQNKINIGNDQLEREMISVQEKINVYYKKECDGARVRSRVTHFEEGESNSKYFLNLEHRNGARKCITELRIGRRVESETRQVINFVENFYSSLYTTKYPDMTAVDAYFKQIKSPHLCENEADECEKGLTMEDITKALKGMKINKAPGIDGLTVEFYREFWIEIQELVLGSLNEGYEKGNLSYLQRKGVVSLIFKGGDAMELGNWRPITLLNTDYKILASVLANRIQKVLPQLVSEDQVGYIKGRSGIYNARLIQDIIDYSNFNNIEGAVIFADFQKAFDTLEWNFIDASLKHYGFKNNFRKWISVMYGDPYLTILVNGWLTKDIKPSRGIRQGCPISALLFILSIESFSK